MRNSALWFLVCLKSILPNNKRNIAWGFVPALFIVLPIMQPDVAGDTVIVEFDPVDARDEIEAAIITGVIEVDSPDRTFTKLGSPEFHENVTIVRESASSN